MHSFSIFLLTKSSSYLASHIFQTQSLCIRRTFDWKCFQRVPLPIGEDSWVAHTPKNKNRRHIHKHYLYHAAFYGCLHCVKYFVLEAGFDPWERSDNEHHTAADWAAYGITQKEQGNAPKKLNDLGCQCVLDFLQHCTDTDAEMLPLDDGAA